MRPLGAWGLVAAAALLTLGALVLGWPLAMGLALASLVVMRRGRLAFLALVLVAVAVNAAVLGATGGWGGAATGAVAGIRLGGVLGVNLALLSRVPPARIIDALRLPPRATTWMAAVLLAAHDVGRDFSRLRDARRLDGEWPEGRLAAARAAVALLPALVVSAERRARVRRDALRLAGIATPPDFVPIVAVAALGAAGRLALIALPNVALTYVVVFLGGLLYGWRVGVAGGALAMVLTDLLLSGLYPLGFVNVPAMALVGLAGAAMRGFDFDGASRIDRAAGFVFAFATGVFATLAFSVSADTLTWLVGTRAAAGAWLPLVVAGLVFNVIPAALNGTLFALSVRPVVRAHQALREGGASAAAAPASPDAQPVAA